MGTVLLLLGSYIIYSCMCVPTAYPFSFQYFHYIILFARHNIVFYLVSRVFPFVPFFFHTLHDTQSLIGTIMPYVCSLCNTISDLNTILKKQNEARALIFRRMEFLTDGFNSTLRVIERIYTVDICDCHPFFFFFFIFYNT